MNKEELSAHVKKNYSTIASGVVKASDLIEQELNLTADEVAAVMKANKIKSKIRDKKKFYYVKK